MHREQPRQHVEVPNERRLIRQPPNPHDEEDEDYEEDDEIVSVGSFPHLTLTGSIHFFPGRRGKVRVGPRPAVQPVSSGSPARSSGSLVNPASVGPAQPSPAEFAVHSLGLAASRSAHSAQSTPTEARPSQCGPTCPTF
ncbi:hypothetical protein CRG98_006707 [Punica granatum]|uniref:Uncharacterized protein n=1 Tax=Punica granatum TaxID=22663 RepID=A0A2I0KWQ3_PUNGR|nr:hypothetical protein CRG98_006707 [Punica granatum]